MESSCRLPGVCQQGIFEKTPRNKNFCEQCLVPYVGPLFQDVLSQCLENGASGRFDSKSIAEFGLGFFMGGLETFLITSKVPDVPAGKMRDADGVLMVIRP